VFLDIIHRPVLFKTQRLETVLFYLKRNVWRLVWIPNLFSETLGDGEGMESPKRSVVNRRQDLITGVCNLLRVYPVMVINRRTQQCWVLVFIDKLS
jgi:hypothetical protein